LAWIGDEGKQSPHSVAQMRLNPMQPRPNLNPNLSSQSNPNPNPRSHLQAVAQIKLVYRIERNQYDRRQIRTIISTDNARRGEEGKRRNTRINCDRIWNVRYCCFCVGVKCVVVRGSVLLFWWVELYNYASDIIYDFFFFFPLFA